MRCPKGFKKNWYVSVIQVFWHGAEQYDSCRHIITLYPQNWFGPSYLLVTRGQHGIWPKCDLIVVLWQIDSYGYLPDFIGPEINNDTFNSTLDQRGTSPGCLLKQSRTFDSTEGFDSRFAFPSNCQSLIPFLGYIFLDKNMVTTSTLTLSSILEELSVVWHATTQ